MRFCQAPFCCALGVGLQLRSPCATLEAPTTASPVAAQCQRFLTAMEVQSDVLKLCSSREQRELVKWLYARSIFFCHPHLSRVFRCSHERLYADGLALARQSDHEEARLLVSVFPNGPPGSRAEAAAVLGARHDDARLVCWAAQCGAQPRRELLRRSAAGGCGWAMTEYSFFADAAERTQLLEKAAAAQEPKAMATLARQLWQEGDGGNDARARLLWQRAAYLGEHGAQFDFARNCCDDGSPEQAVWMRRSAVQEHGFGIAFDMLASWACEQHEQRHDGTASSRIVFEVGAALAAIDGWREKLLHSRHAAACEWALQQYRRLCGGATRAVLCWLWLARMERLAAKDVRLLIARLVWDERAAWSNVAIEDAPQEPQ